MQLSGVQAKSNGDHSGDILEQEADKVAGLAKGGLEEETNEAASLDLHPSDLAVQRSCVSCEEVEET